VIAREDRDGAAGASIAGDVRDGLTARPKALPPYLFYDDRGSRLYELITDLPEYYLCRAERGIIAAHAREMVARVVGGPAPASVIELGSGSASKTAVLLSAMLERQPRCAYFPIDVSSCALAAAEKRLAREVPGVHVHALPMTYEAALSALGEIPPPRIVLFLGSSVGNLPDVTAVALLRRVRRALPGETWLLMGTDLRKNPGVLRAAYDDAAGVTAAFNKNILHRINRDLGGHFDPDQFRHLALWNDGESRIEMHLESAEPQEIAVDALHLQVRFRRGETIHTESSCKYDLPRIERLLSAAGFSREASYSDGEGAFAVHLAAGA
jgi:dimethylhistidine N-methyltransferase